jgi:DNA-binding MarR family transcriptional regulator
VPRITKSQTDAVVAGEIIDALAPLLAHQRRSWAARCQAYGLSIIGLQVIALLEMHGAMTMSRLADDLGVALPNATGIVARLAERGVIARGHDADDRRVVRVELTDEGRRLIAEIEANRRDRMSRLIGALDRTQQARLLQSVRDLGAAALSLHEPNTHATEPSHR